jgi:hypothetical protein
MRRLASERAKGVADRRGGNGKCIENRKKILNSGNEPKNVLKTKELSFSGAKNELVFERKKGQTNPKKRPKNNLLCGFEPGTVGECLRRDSACPPSPKRNGHRKVE